MDGGDGCTMISMYLMPLNCALKNGLKFRLYIFYIIKISPYLIIVGTFSCLRIIITTFSFGCVFSISKNNLNGMWKGE